MSDNLDSRARRARASLQAAERRQLVAPPPTGSRHRGVARTVSTALALVAVLVAVGVVFLDGWRPGTVVRPAVMSGVPAGDRPVAVVIDGDRVYVGDAGAGSVRAYDARSLEPVWQSGEAARPVSLALGDGALWVVDEVGRRLLALDPSNGAPLASAATSLGALSVAVTPGTVWVLSPGNGTLDRYDAVSVVQRGSVRVPTTARAVVSGDGALWVTTQDSLVRVALDATRDVGTTSVPLPAEPVGVAPSGGSVWVALGDSRVLRLAADDLATTAQTVTLGSAPTAITSLADGAAAVATVNGGLLRLVPDGATSGLPPTGSPLSALDAHDRVLVGVSTSSGMLYATEVPR